MVTAYKMLEEEKNSLTIDDEFLKDFIKLGKSMSNSEIGGFCIACPEVTEGEEVDGLELDSPIDRHSSSYVIDSESFVLPKQRVSSGTTEFDEEWLARYYELNKESLSKNMLVWWHSHHNMNVTPSLQDEVTLQKLSKSCFSNLACMLITNNSGDTYSAIGSYNMGMFFKDILDISILTEAGSHNYKFMPSDIEGSKKDKVSSIYYPPLSKKNYWNYGKTYNSYKDGFEEEQLDVNMLVVGKVGEKCFACNLSIFNQDAYEDYKGRRWCTECYGFDY